ncbi:type IV secretory system conjugative DNA transfer family protein [Chryseotalea sanaruensis]|nr:TraM recognition domain-containing protein [Chryseotalea sanaruensis]
MQGFDLDTILINFNGKTTSDNWTIRNAVEGVQIFGGIGSGKTSGSGRLFALKYLKAGFGGLVLTAKPDEKKLWEDYCRLTGRLGDMVVIEPGGKNNFNFLEYESKNSSPGMSITGNIVHVLKTVLKASEEKQGGKSDDMFWENSTDLLMHNLVDLCKLAYGALRIKDLYEIAQSLPKTENELLDPKLADRPYQKAIRIANKKVKEKLDEWERKFDLQELSKMEKEGTSSGRAMEDIPELHLLSQIEDFFHIYIPMSEKTRSIIDFSFVGFLSRFMHEPVYSLFSNKISNIEPEDCLRGAIIVLNLPVKSYGKVGRDAQIMFKYIWQRAMERRDPKYGQRPVFLWADESQNFLHEHDADYQATARSSRICTVYISQNLPNYYANMGGEKSEYRVKSFLGTLNTKIFHANADIETNTYSSTLIGEAEYERKSIGATAGVNNISGSQTSSTHTEKIVRPEVFVKLKTGGSNNDGVIEAYIHRPGAPFSTGDNHLKTKFNQSDLKL